MNICKKYIYLAFSSTTSNSKLAASVKAESGLHGSNVFTTGKESKTNLFYCYSTGVSTALIHCLFVPGENSVCRTLFPLKLLLASLM